MVTIIVDTKAEYDEMMEIGQDFVCRRIRFSDCLHYPPNSCDICFKDNYAKFSIRIIPPVDSDKPSEL